MQSSESRAGSGRGTAVSQEIQRPLPKQTATLPKITVEARYYALKELARRAGVSRAFFESWKIESTAEKTVVSLGSEVHGQIVFVHQNLTDPIAAKSSVARAGWLNPSEGSALCADLILPFCESREDARKPLYQSSAPNASVSNAPVSNDSILNSVTCRLDVLRSVLFTLSRTEETMSESVDEHQRFPASASLAVQHNFVERPILDEHGLAFEQALLALCPGWRPQRPAFRVNLTHDIDDIGMPFEFRTAFGHSLKRHRPAGTVRDLLSTCSSIEPVELLQVRKLAEISAARGLHSAFFWKGSSRTPHDSGYDPGHFKVQRVIESLRQRGFELGVHPGYQTFRDRANLASEVAHLRQTLRISSAGGRQHYLRWCPATWLDWEACGLAYDSSLGYADRFGFRAGTAFPYHPWSFEYNRELQLIEIPLILMDCTPVKYMRLALSEGLPRIATLIGRVKRTGGVFSLLWHNTPLIDPEYAGWYEAILDLLAGVKSFDLAANLPELW